MQNSRDAETSSKDAETSTHASELREEIRERSNPLPGPVREELFGLEELGPTLVLDMIGQPTTFRGLGDGEDKLALKQKLVEAVHSINADRPAAVKKFDELVAKRRGQALVNGGSRHEDTQSEGSREA